MRELNEAQHLHRQHREHARHEVQDQPADYCEPGGEREVHARCRLDRPRYRLASRRCGFERPHRHIHRECRHLRVGVPATWVNQCAGQALDGAAAGREREAQPIADALQHGLDRVLELPLTVRKELRRAVALCRPGEVDVVPEPRRLHRHRQLSRQARAGGRDGALPGGVGFCPVQHWQVEHDFRLLGQAQVLADQVTQCAAQAHRAGHVCRWRHRNRQQHGVLVAVGHHRWCGHLLRVGPLDGAGREAGRQPPVDPRRLAGIAGVLPVDVPAAIELELHAERERLPRQHAAHVGQQAHASVWRVLGGYAGRQQCAQQRDQPAHGQLIDRHGQDRAPAPRSRARAVSVP